MPDPFVHADPDIRFRFELLDMGKEHYVDLFEWVHRDVLAYLDEPIGHSMVGFFHKGWVGPLAKRLNDGLNPDSDKVWLFCNPDWPGEVPAHVGSNMGVLLRWAADNKLVALCDYAEGDKDEDDAGPAGNIIGYLHVDHADEVLRVLNATDDRWGVFALISTMTPVIRPSSDWGGDGPDPRVADAWFWTVGNEWCAVVREAEVDTWWDGSALVPGEGEFPIWQLPPSGTLRFRDADGNDRALVIPTNVWGVIALRGGTEPFLDWCQRTETDVRSTFDVPDQEWANITGQVVDDGNRPCYPELDTYRTKIIDAILAIDSEDPTPYYVREITFGSVGEDVERYEWRGDMGEFVPVPLRSMSFDQAEAAGFDGTGRT